MERMTKMQWAVVVVGVGSLTILASWGGYAAGPSQSMAGLQHLYDQKDYQRTLDEIGKLDQQQAGRPDIRRLKTRALLRLGRPKDALAEYDQLTVVLKHEDVPLLREVSMGFIVVMMKDMREQMRGAAYTALKEVDSDETVPLFEDGLSDGSGLVRALAAEGLAKLQSGRRSERFRKAVDDEAALVKEAVLKGLGRSQDASVIALVEPAVKDEEVRVRVAAAEALCRLGRQHGCDAVERSARAPNPDERTSAIKALVDLQRPNILPVLLEASEHKQPSVRGAAAGGLAHVPRRDALPSLVRLLSDPLPPVRIAAAVSLGRLRAFDAVEALKKTLEDRDASVRAFAVGSLLEVGVPYDSVAASVTHLSNDKEPAIRTAIARALGHASGQNKDPALDALLVLVTDTLPRVRMAALKSLGRLTGKDGIQLLKQGLHDEDDAVRTTAGGALLHISQPK